MQIKTLFILYLLIFFNINERLNAQKTTDEPLLLGDSVLLSFVKTPSIINSSWSETHPLMNATEQVLIFNRTRKKSKKTVYEVLLSKKTLGKWTRPEDISNAFKSEKNVQVSDISPDGQTLIISSGKKRERNLLITRLENDKWSKPVEFNENINSEWDEKSASLSYDERILIFSSNRPGGLGGYDLYASYKQDDGTWSEAKNLGKNVNSYRDEVSPSLHTNGKTLYFSSNKKDGIGRLDVYYSTLKDSVWSESKNLGPKVNTKKDDAFFRMGIGQKSAWWASEHSNGKYDIKFLEITQTSTLPKQVVYRGMVYMEDYKPTDNVEITISDAESKELVGEYRPNPITGEYIYILDPEKTYNILLTATGYLGYTHDFYVPSDSSYQIIHRSIELNPIKFYTPPVMIAEGEKYNKVKDILFGVNDTETLKYNKNLNKLAQHLVSNPNCVIEIGGHTDDTGNATYNRELAMKRAQNVADYLLGQGVNKESFIIRNYGPNAPIAGNGKEESQRFNRRVEFRIMKQGKVKLMIQKISVPAKYSLGVD